MPMRIEILFKFIQKSMRDSKDRADQRIKLSESPLDLYWTIYFLFIIQAFLSVAYTDNEAWPKYNC